MIDIHILFKICLISLTGAHMKLEELLKKCPKCGSQDKTAQRKIIDEHKSRATLKAIVCEKCGYVFESEENNKKEE